MIIWRSAPGGVSKPKCSLADPFLTLAGERDILTK